MSHIKLIKTMEVINSFIDNFKQKITNPFFGTLILVWCIRNWELVYTLFNFDDDCLLVDKKYFINEYFRSKNLFIEFLTNFGYALFFLIIGYIFVIISRILINYVYHRIIPFLNNFIVDKALVVDSKRFDIVKKQRDESFSKIIELNETIVGLEQKNTILKNNEIELNSKILQQDNTIDLRNNEIENADKKISELERNYSILIQEKKLRENEEQLNKKNRYEIEKRILEIYNKNKHSIKDINKNKEFSNSILPIYENLIKNDLVEYFIEISNKMQTEIISDMYMFVNQNKLNELEEMKLIISTENREYKLTELGKILFDNFNNFHKNL